MAGPEGVKLQKKRMLKPESSPFAWKRRWIAEEMEKDPSVEELSRSYMDHLGICKTEREAVRYWQERLMSEGFVDLSEDEDAPLVPGDGFVLVNRKKEIVAGIVSGAEPSSGWNIIASHLDSPRLDLKPMPLDGDRDTGLGIFRTHYYGGIKKYQWVNIPLSLHGRVVKEDGSVVDLCIGEEEGDPVFTIPDLEPHLSHKVQDHRRLEDGIRGEELLPLTASGRLPNDDEERTPVVLDVLSHLKKGYGIVEEDLISSELCLVPSWKPRSIGLDRGMIGAYGHDNRVSTYSALEALSRLHKAGKGPERTSLVICFDKEEIGSDGNTGAKSMFMELAVYRLMKACGIGGSRRELQRTLSSSFAISADVKAAMDPLWKSVHDPQNSARMGSGITITKYTGRGGKFEANDASAEMVSSLRRLFNREKVVWQMQETGRVDEGGGNTVAKFIAARNMDVVDVGIPVLSMHSPFEVISKSDLYMAVKGFSAFLSWFPA